MNYLLYRKLKHDVIQRRALGRETWQGNTTFGGRHDDLSSFHQGSSYQATWATKSPSGGWLRSTHPRRRNQSCSTLSEVALLITGGEVSNNGSSITQHPLTDFPREHRCLNIKSTWFRVDDFASANIDIDRHINWHGSCVAH